MQREHWAYLNFLLEPCPFKNSVVQCPICLNQHNYSKLALFQTVFSKLFPCLSKPSMNNNHETIEPIDPSLALKKLNSDFHDRCQKYVDALPLSNAMDASYDNLSECNATVNSCDYTNVNGRTFSCRYRKMSEKRIVSHINIETIDGKTIDALIDTGATISVISKSFLQKIKHSVHAIKPCKSFSVTLSIESDAKFNVNEQAEFCFKLNDEVILWRFFVLSNLSNEVVLGIDFLSEYKVSIDCNPFKISICKPSRTKIKPFSKETEYGNDADSTYASAWDTNLSFPNPATKPDESFPSSLTNSTLKPCRNNSVRVDKRTVLAPMSYTRVPIVSSKYNGDMHIIPRRELTESLNLLIGNCIVTAENNKADMFICNATKKDVILNERTVIGNYISFENDNILCNLDEIYTENKHTIASIRTSNDDADSKNKLFESLKFGKEINFDEKSRLIKLINEYSDVFAYKENDRGQTHLVEHTIETKDALPIKQRAYKQAFVERTKTREMTNNLLNEGIIQHSSSPWSSPIVLVKKKDGATRFCVDYRLLNSVTKKDNYPLPRIDDALDRLNGAKYFSSMDCDQAYYQVPVKPADKEKTAFITPDGLFEFNYMPFGLCNAPATFQRLIDVILGRLKWTIALVYLDDIIVYSRTFDEHIVNLSLVFAALKKAGLKLKPSKCNFCESQLLFLGHVISADGVAVNPVKIKAVKDFPKPKRRRDILSFVALCSYYRRFIQNFAKIARPLHRLTEKNVKFVWDENAENAFMTLKEKLVSSDVLAYPDEDAPTAIHCDASSFGLGATLVQIQNNVERVIAFASRSLKRHERNYSATELECAAVIFAVDTFRPHLYGKKFQIVTDHCALCYLLKTKDPQGKLARWALKLQPYDYEIIYKSGKKHMDADPLSRNPVDKPPPSDHETLDFVDLLCSLSLTEPNDIIALQEKDAILSTIKTAVSNNDEKLMPKKYKLADFTLKCNVLYKINNSSYFETPNNIRSSYKYYWAPWSFQNLVHHKKSLFLAQNVCTYKTLHKWLSGMPIS